MTAGSTDRGAGAQRSARVQACAQISADLAATVAAIRTEVNAAVAVTAEETGWRVDGDSWWLWAAATDIATIYAIGAGRGEKDAAAVLDLSYDGTIVADGWVIYRTAFANAVRQGCLAHRLRHANELETDNPSWARSTPRQIKTILHRALDARGIPPGEAATLIEDLTELTELLAEQSHPHEPNRKLGNHLARELPDDALFTFLEPGCDATNGRGEQAMRPAVVNRKVYEEQEPGQGDHPGSDHECDPHRPPTRRRRRRAPPRPRPRPQPRRTDPAPELPEHHPPRPLVKSHTTGLPYRA